jgi:hypothetical protein
MRSENLYIFTIVTAAPAVGCAGLTIRFGMPARTMSPLGQSRRGPLLPVGGRLPLLPRKRTQVQGIGICREGPTAEVILARE